MRKNFTSSMTIIPKEPEKGRFREFELYIDRRDGEYAFIFRDKKKNHDMRPTYAEKRIGVISSMINHNEIKEELGKYLRQVGSASSGNVMIGGRSSPVKIDDLPDYLIGEAEKLDSPIYIVPKKWRYAVCAGLLCTALTLTGDSIIDGNRKEKLDKALYLLEKYDDHLPESEQDKLGWEMEDIGLKPLSEGKYKRLEKSVNEEIEKERKLPSDKMKENQ